MRGPDVAAGVELFGGKATTRAVLGWTFGELFVA
jgi:hypothetical protein